MPYGAKRKPKIPSLQFNVFSTTLQHLEANLAPSLKYLELEEDNVNYPIKLNYLSPKL